MTEGFSEEDIEFAVKWTIENSKEKPYDFSLIKEPIGQAMAAKKEEETKKANRLEKEKLKIINQQEENKKENPILIGAIITWTVVFFLVFEPLGYIVSTTLYFFPLMVYFNKKKWWANCFVSVLSPIVIYILFVKLLGVNLPRGIINW